MILFCCVWAQWKLFEAPACTSLEIESNISWNNGQPVRGRRLLLGSNYYYLSPVLFLFYHRLTLFLHLLHLILLPSFLPLTFFSIFFLPSFVQPSVTTTAIQWRYYLCGTAEKYQSSCLSVTPVQNRTMRLEGRFNADSDELHPAESQPIEATLDAFHPRGTEEYFLRQLYWRPTSFMGIPTAQLHRGNFQERIHFFPFTAIFRGTRIDRRERAFAKLSCRRQKLYDQVRSKFPLDEAILENVERNVTTEYSLSDRSLKICNATFNFIPVHTYTRQIKSESTRV